MTDKLPQLQVTCGCLVGYLVFFVVESIHRKAIKDLWLVEGLPSYPSCSCSLRFREVTLLLGIVLDWCW